VEKIKGKKDLLHLYHVIIECYIKFDLNIKVNIKVKGLYCQGSNLILG
jgi:hypothetical protein